MAFTYTSTFTNVYVVGEQLANSSSNLELARKQMKDIEIKFADELHKRGVKFIETDDVMNLSWMKFQWQTLRLAIPETEITKIIDLL